MTTLLFVDNDTEQRRHMAQLAAGFGYKVLEASSESSARALLNSRINATKGVDLLIIDAGLLHAEGALVKLCGKAAAVIVSVAARDSHNIPALMQRGAVDFVAKPVNPQRLQVSITNAIRLQVLAHDLKQMRATVVRQPAGVDLVAHDAAMVRALSVATRAARTDMPVLIEGESGTGRESVARMIHSQAGGADERRARPFVILHCQGAEAPDRDMLAARMHEAQAGTLYLADVDALAPALQAQLMRFIIDGDERRRKGVRPDIRVIAATRTSLLDRVKGGAFREDLFYRLNVMPITLPPLRARRSDIGPLVHLFTTRFSALEGKAIDSITPEAMALLSNYGWPGNVAELENTVYRAVALAEGGSLGLDEFPKIAAIAVEKEKKYFNLNGGLPSSMHGYYLNSQDGDNNLQLFSAYYGARDEEEVQSLTIALTDERGEIRSLDELETDAIRSAIRHYQGRISEVSRRLGIGRSTLYRKMKTSCLDFEEASEKDTDCIKPGSKPASTFGGQKPLMAN